MGSTDTVVVIVGGGAAGITAAIGLAKRKIPVVVVEGAPFPGAENWSGAVYFAENLVRPEILGPGGLETAAVERRVVRRGILLSDGRVAVGGAVRSKSAFEHCYTVLRPVFDHDLAARARMHGAVILGGTTALALIRDGDRVRGVLTDRGPIYADLTFLAEGDASRIVAREGLETKASRDGRAPEPEFLQGVKEVLEIEPAEIERRFGVGPGEGACLEILLRNGTVEGRPVALNAGLFLYTNRDSVSLGLVAPLENLKALGVEHNVIMERVKELPALKGLLRGAKQRSFGAKLIRGGGFREMPRLVLDGLVVGGAAAGLGVDFPCPNYTGPATYCGFLASEAVHRIRESGRPYDAAALTEHYEKPLRESHYVADSEHLKDWPAFVSGGKEFFGRQVDLVAGAAHVLTDLKFGVLGRHFLAARRLAETLPLKKVGPFTSEMRRAGAALGLTRGLGGALLRATPRLVWNCLAMWFPSRPKTDGRFEPLFFSDPDPLRRDPPLAIRWLRARFRGALADALFHLYRNDPVPLAKKIAATRASILSRISLIDLLLAPIILVLVYLVGRLHRLGFVAWVALTRPKLDAVLRTPALALQDEERRLGEWSAVKEVVAHDDKLALLTYRGEERSHIRFHVGHDAATGLPETASSVFHVCPARVYLEEKDQSLSASVAVLHENCIKCETCWRADSERVDWGRTRTQRLVFESYTSADAWLRESLEAAALAELGREAEDGPVAVSAPAPAVVTLDSARRETALALMDRVRSTVSGFRPLHEGMPSVLTGADQALLRGVADEAMTALAELDKLLRPLADVAGWERLDALTRWRELAAPRVATRRFFDLEADFELLAVRHLPDLEKRFDLAAGPPRPVSADLSAARAKLRTALAARFDKEAVAEAEHAGRPVDRALDSLQWALRGLIAASEGRAPAPGSAPRDLLFEELARLSPSLAVAAHAHLVALDLMHSPTLDGDAEDVAEVRGALSAVQALAAYADGEFSTDAEGRNSGRAIGAFAGAAILIVPVEGGLAVHGVGDEGVRIETPGALGLAGGGMARAALDGATPRVVFTAGDPTAYLDGSAPKDLIAAVRGMADYAAERALEHAESRVQFPGLFRDVRGRDGVAKFGAVQAMLGQISASRRLMERLRGLPVHGATALALATELLAPGPRSILYLAGQVLGGTAYSEEDPICRFFRDGAALTRVPYEGRAAARRHGRRQIKLIRGGAGKEGEVLVGLDLRTRTLAVEATDPASWRVAIDRVRLAWADVNRALGALDATTADAVAPDLGRLALLAGGYDVLLADARAARRRGVIDPSTESALERFADRAADRAARFVRRLGDATELTTLGALLFKKGVSEGRAHVTTGATTHYGEFLGADDPFASGDLVANPGKAGALCWTPELLDADPLLGRFDEETTRTYRARWRDVLHDGLPYPRLVEREHHVPHADIRWLVDQGAFRRVIPQDLGGLGWKKAKYYLDCVAMMRHGDPSQPLIVMGSTSIGTTPVLIGREQDIPAARRAIEQALAHPERVADVADRLKRVRKMLDGVEAAKAKGPFEEAMGVVKKTLGSEKILRLAFQGFLDAFADAGRAGMKRDLPGFRSGLDRALAALDGWEAVLKSELESLPHRAAMHDFFLRQVSAGRISAFALTEPSAGSDTARIRTKAERVEVESLRDPSGFFVFIPKGGSEPRNLFPLERLSFVDGRLMFAVEGGEPVPVETRDFKAPDEEGPARFRFVRIGDRRVEVHDMGRVVEREGRHFFPYFMVNGQKMWITNGSIAGVMTLYARTDRGPTGFMLDAHQEGLVVGKDERKMGQRGSATNELALKDVRIPIDGVIGIEGRGQENALETLNVGRAGLGITSVGTMHEIVNDVREAFARDGREPSQADLYELGKMAVDLVGSESLAFQLVGRFDHAGTHSIRVESAIGKAETSEAVHRLCTRAERLTGASTVLADGLLEKRRRDARVLTIYEGTNEVQRFLILKDLADSLSTTPPELPQPSSTGAGVAVGLAALGAVRGEVLRRVAEVRARLGSKAWQRVAWQPWMFGLVESYMAAATLSATVRRVALAERLIRDDGGRPRMEYLERALRLMAKSVAELPQGRLAAFDRESLRVTAGEGPWAEAAADRALLAHGKRDVEVRPILAAPPTRRIRVLVVVDPSPAVAPMPRVADGRLAESWCELSDADRGALRGALRLKSRGEADVQVLGIGSPLAGPVIFETLALGADGARLVNIGRRALLAADVAEFAAEFVRTDEDLHGKFDVVVGADRHAGLLLPLARRLGLDAVRGVAEFGVEAAPDLAARCVVRLAKPAVESAVDGPVVLLTSASAAPHEFAATAAELLSARRRGAITLVYEPRESAEGLLKAESHGSRPTGASEAAGPLDASSAAKTFAEEAGLAGGGRAAPAAFEGVIVTGDGAFLRGAAAIAVVRADENGASQAARHTVDAAHAIARGGRVVAVVVLPSNDEGLVRKAAGALIRDGADVLVVADPALADLPDAALGRALESALAESGVASAVFAPDLRGAGLTAGEGRAAADAKLILVDGIDRIEAVGDKFRFSGPRLDGRARYVVERPQSAPVQLMLRGEPTLVGIELRPSGRAAAVALRHAPAGIAGGDLAEALRDAARDLGVASLAEAEFILDIGYGVGSRDGIEEVVEPMKAALERLGVRNVMIGASRKVTQDLGILPDAMQIGQTGVSVNPRLMIALGVSGAPQHVNYIGERAVVFAFNKDAEAPLMTLNRSRPKPKVYPVVGDLFVEAPRFIRALEQDLAVGAGAVGGAGEGSDVAV